MQDLETSPQACRLEVELAQALALAQLIANEQRFTIEAAADRLQLRIHGQRLQPGQLLPAAADLISQRIHQRMDSQGGCTHRGSWETGCRS